MGKFLYISFFTTAEAMETEVVMQELGLSGKLVPVPRAISAGCGISWRTEDLDREKIEKILLENEIEWEELTIL